MSVADYFGFDDPESALMTEARAGWVRWCAEDPDLAVVDDLTDLRAWTWRAEREPKGYVFGRLAEIAQTEDAARAALVWLAYARSSCPCTAKAASTRSKGRWGARAST